MPKFRRRSGETAAEWYDRLSRVDAAALKPRQLDDLTLRRIEAERARRREGAAPAAGGPAPPVAAAAPPDAFQQCKEAVRALSPEDRLRLIWWLQSGMAD
jgi:hypothetical protein